MKNERSLGLSESRQRGKDHKSLFEGLRSRLIIDFKGEMKISI